MSPAWRTVRTTEANSGVMIENIVTVEEGGGACDGQYMKN